MSENAYYLGSERFALDSDEGNGVSIPLGAPLIGDAASLRPELDKTPFRLADRAKHARARKLLERLTSSALLSVLNLSRARAATAQPSIAGRARQSCKRRQTGSGARALIAKDAKLLRYLVEQKGNRTSLKNVFPRIWRARLDSNQRPPA
jgi:hypothetical protein